MIISDNPLPNAKIMLTRPIESGEEVNEEGNAGNPSAVVI
jgi:hypothetical protein